MRPLKFRTWKGVYVMHTRTLKFRAWQKNGTKMIDLQKITPLILNKDQDGVFLPFHKDIYIMQYTGLKDKNGVEIYEGDIVKWSGEIGEVYWDQADVTFSLRWEGNSWFIPEIGILEIIGNIYEDSELVDK